MSLAELDTFHGNIRAALRTALVGMSGAIAKRAWENIKFTPPNDPPEPWMRDKLVWGPLERESLGKRALLRSTGTYSVDAFFLPGQGTKPAEDWVGSMLGVFNTETVANYDDVHVNIVRAYPKDGRPDRGGEWWMQPFVIEWYADAVNPT